MVPASDGNERHRPLPRPVPLRPLTVADTFDGAFAVVKARPRTIFAIGAAFVLPLVVLQILLTPEGLTTSQFEAAFDDSEPSSSDVGFTYLYLVLNSVMLPLVGAGVAHVVAAWYAGSELGAPAAIGRVLRRSHILLTAWLLSHVLIVIGLIGVVVGSLAFMALYLVVAPVVAIEGRGPAAALGRSQKLCGKRFFPVMWIAVLTGVVSTTIESALPLLAETIVAIVGDRFDWLFHASAAIVTRLILTPVVAATAVIVYLDLRVRYEGLDLELDLADRSRAA